MIFRFIKLFSITITVVAITFSLCSSQDKPEVYIYTDSAFGRQLSVTDLAKNKNLNISGIQAFYVTNGVSRPLTAIEFNSLKIKQVKSCNLNFKFSKNDINKTVNINLSAPSCECFTSIGVDTSQFNLEITQNNIQEHFGTIYIISNIKNVPFFSKCAAIFWWSAFSLLLGIYLFGIYNKSRFNGNSYFKSYSITPELTTTRVKNLPLASNFVKRWLIPFVAESNTIEGLVFIASSNRNVILLSKKTQSSKMTINGLSINRPGTKEISISHNMEINIENANSTRTMKYHKG
jgi:hypothetical protein